MTNWNWTDLTPRQRLAAMDLMKATIEAEIRSTMIEFNRELKMEGAPFEIEIEVILRVDPSRDPRLERE